MNNKYIGVFDSGMGGLTVVKSIIETMPNENIIFLGDTANIPYGIHPMEKIAEFVLNDVKFLSRFDLKAIVIACNTADCAAREKVEELYPLPVFGVIRPAAKKAAEATKNNRIGVIATNATVSSGAYEKNIKALNPSAEIISVACPKLVPLIESGHFGKGDEAIESALEEYLVPLKKQGIDTLVLGCTHYPLLSDIIADMLPDINIVNSSAAESEALKDELYRSSLQSDTESGDIKFFVSGNAEPFEKLARLVLGETVKKVEHAEI